MTNRFSMRSRILACVLGSLSSFACTNSAPSTATTLRSSVQGTGCTADERRDALREVQDAVLAQVPCEVESLDEATRPGGSLAGWRLSHGLVVLAGSGAVAVDNIAAAPPMPQLLLYAPSSASAPADWLDFDGPDGPYRLIGWAYIAPYEEGSRPPQRPCIGVGEWLVHEAGWHLMDGGMHLTPGAAVEPPRPEQVAVYFWHPRVWDLHVWLGEDGVPSIAYGPPDVPEGGVELPEGAFLQLVNGRLTPLEQP